ncbi:MAG: cobalamin biosynthesis protein [Bdellovibrionales bacterium]
MIEFLSQWHASFFDPDRIPTIIFAVLLCVVVGMITGPMTGNANAFLWQFLDRFVGRLGDKMDKASRPKGDLIFRGFILTTIVILFLGAMGKGFEAIAIDKPFHGVTEVILLSFAFSAGTVWFALLKLYFAMDQDKVVKGAFLSIARSTRTDLKASDAFGITRMGMNFAARSFDKNLVAPAIWYLIAGFVGVCLYAGLAALSWRFGKEGATKGFGSTALALEKLLGFFPSILSGILLTLASLFTPTAKLHKGLMAWFGHKNRASYEQGGFALSAMAWGLNVSLGGPAKDLNGDAIKNTWVGPQGATAKNDHTHLRRAIWINVIAHLLFIVTMLSLYTWSGILQGVE